MNVKLSIFGLMYVLIFFIGFQFSLKFRKVVKLFLGIRNYIFIFWAVLPVVFSWYLGKLNWISPPKMHDLILIPVGLTLTFSVLIPEYWYRIMRERNEILIRKLRALRFSAKGWLLKLGLQIYNIGLPEEFISRGFLITFLADSLGSTVSVLLSATLFGIIHLRSTFLGDPLRAFCTCIHGLIYGSIFILSGSVWIPVTVHILANLLSVPVVKAMAYRVNI